MDKLDRINALGALMPGFVWTRRDESGHAMDMRAPWRGKAANLTVWEDVASLERFVWKTVHARVYNRRAEWFERARVHLRDVVGTRGTPPRAGEGEGAARPPRPEWVHGPCLRMSRPARHEALVRGVLPVGARGGTLRRALPACRGKVRSISPA